MDTRESRVIISFYDFGAIGALIATLTAKHMVDSAYLCLALREIRKE
jgi:hypothetical protein